MKDFNDKLNDCVLTDENLASVAGGVSGSEKRTVVVCPLCNCVGTYGSLNESFSAFMAHYKCLKGLGLADESNIANYIKSVWDAAAPVEE